MLGINPAMLAMHRESRAVPHDALDGIALGSKAGSRFIRLLSIWPQILFMFHYAAAVSLMLCPSSRRAFLLF